MAEMTLDALAQRMTDLERKVAQLAAPRPGSVKDWRRVVGGKFAKNERLLKEGEPLISAHLSGKGHPFWVITNCDRSATTIWMLEAHYACE